MSGRSDRHAYRQLASATLLAAVFLLTAAFRFLALRNGFPNDNFVAITSGWQMQFGEWPSNHFFDRGEPLMLWASAAAQALFGQTLFAEAALVAVAFGVAAVFTVAAVTHLTGSRTLALLAAALEVAIFPRTYGYPKILVYAVAFWAFGRYLKRPSTGWRCGLAAAVAVAFLFRHDHGLFLFVGALLTIVLTHAPQGIRTAIRPTGTFVVFLAVMLLPYLIFVERYTGLWLYFSMGLNFSLREASRQWHVWPSLFGERPLEAALLYQLYLLPVVTAMAVAAHWRRQRSWSWVAQIAPVAVVAVMVNFSFIRDPLNTRLPDVIVPAVILVSWLVHKAWTAVPKRQLVAPASIALLALFGWSVATAGGVADELDRAGLFTTGWQQMPERFQQRREQLRDRFASGNVPSDLVGRLRPFFAYLDRCTTIEDRLLYGGHPPDVPFFAQRLFAGGQSYFGGFANVEEQQRLVVERLRRQRVPFFIIPSDYVDEFEGRFPIVNAYVSPRYALLSVVPVDEDMRVLIFVDSELPFASRDSETGFPCRFADGADG